MQKLELIILGKIRSVKLESSPHPDYLITERFRPEKLKANYHDKTLVSRTLESEFINDIKFQVDTINTVGRLDGKSMVTVLKTACKKHISKYSRLIDTDLYTYVDCSLHIIDSVQTNEMEKLNRIYSTYVDVLIEEFKNSIYIANPPHGLTKLTSLSGFSNNSLNMRSADMVRTVFNNLKNHPSYKDFTVTIKDNDIEGSSSITITKNGQNVSKFYFYPLSSNGNIESIAIYGSQLNEQYNTIKNSKLVFGLRISKIELVTTNTQSPFVDVSLQPY